MQGFSINHQEEELISEKAIRHKVGQCFPQVEKGSFFPGDAYAIYSEWLKYDYTLIILYYTSANVNRWICSFFN